MSISPLSSNQSESDRSRSQCGVSLVEYGLLVALLSLVVIGAMMTMGRETEGSFWKMCVAQHAANSGIDPPAVEYDENSRCWAFQGGACISTTLNCGTPPD